MEIGNILRKLLDKHGMTQPALADKSGLSLTLIKGLVNNRIKNTSIDTLEKIAAVFNIKVKDFFDDDFPAIPLEIRNMNEAKIIEWFEVISLSEGTNKSPRLIKKLIEIQNEIALLEKEK